LEELQEHDEENGQKIQDALGDQGEDWQQVTKNELESLRDRLYPEFEPCPAVEPFEKHCCDGTRFYPWGDPSLPKGVVCCNHITMDWPEDQPDDPMDLDTSAVDQVLLDQLERHEAIRLDSDDAHILAGLKKGTSGRRVPSGTFEAMLKEIKVRVVLEWLYVLMGRIMHWVSEHDNWQVILALVGKAGTGKSTILELIQSIYESEDVGNVAGKGDKFSISSVAETLLWTCAEMARDTDISQQQIQQMISGERISIRGFHKDWKQVRWNIPGLLAGNFMFGFTNDQGSLTRRFLMTSF